MEAVYRSSSWTVARHYGLLDRGAVAPGYRADLVLLGDREACGIEGVFVGGERVAEMDLPSAKIGKHPNTVRAKAPRAEELVGPEGRVHVIAVEAGKILTGRQIAAHDAAGVARLTVLERYGGRSRPANAYVSGFGESFQGAIASSVGHDSHNLIVVGSNAEDMAVALKSLIECGGGYSVVRDGSLKARLALPLGGLMSDQEAPVVEKALSEMRGICRAQGCILPEPFLQLAFLSLPVIPSLKLTDRGLVDVDAFKLIGVRA
jgi:adenine deaminase